MPGSNEQMMVATALATALVHTLIPDHWLPFVLLGRARGWSAGTTAWISGLSAMIHTLLSIGLGGLALGLGYTAAVVVGEGLERASSWLLVAFGIGYALWAWRKGGHFHPGGRRLHGAESAPSCPGEEGPGNPEHLHYHADDQLIRGRGERGAYWLALIVGANPCVLLLPIMLHAAPRGPWAVGAVTLAYSLPTVVLMVSLAVLGTSAGWRIRLPLAARHMEAVSGLLVALLGLALLMLDLDALWPGW